MEQKQLDELLSALPRVECDSRDFSNAVWREIRHRKALGESSLSFTEFWFASLRGIFAPTAIAGLAAAVLVAWLVGSSSGFYVPQRTVTTARVLNLEVFGPQAEGLAHSRLVVGR